MSSSLFSLSGSVSVSSWFVSYRVPKVFDLLFSFDISTFRCCCCRHFYTALYIPQSTPPPGIGKKLFIYFYSADFLSAFFFSTSLGGKREN